VEFYFHVPYTPTCRGAQEHEKLYSWQTSGPCYKSITDLGDSWEAKTQKG